MGVFLEEKILQTLPIFMHCKDYSCKLKFCVNKLWIQATLSDPFLADLEDLSDNEADLPVSTWLF